MAERRPRIAVPARFSTSASALRYGAEVTSRNLVEAVYAAGGEPLVLHPYAPGGVADDAEVAARLAGFDGVLLPGGGDLAAHWTGQGAHPTLYDVDDEQDAFDLALARVCLDAAVPLLAVCRGLQVVNAVRGGTVVQDMDEAYGELRHHRHRVHTISVEPGSLLAGVVGEQVESSCYHHQCLDTLGAGLVAVARAEEGVVEAVELTGARGWFLGVQWHPEDTWATSPGQLAVFRALVDAAR
jgi:putative glutamine amidotransferase